MTNQSASVGYLRNVSDALGLIRTTTMPHLIVEHNDTSRFAEIILDFIFPLRSLYRIRR